MRTADYYRMRADDLDLIAHRQADKGARVDWLRIANRYLLLAAELDEDRKRWAPSQSKPIPSPVFNSAVKQFA